MYCEIRNEQAYIKHIYIKQRLLNCFLLLTSLFLCELWIVKSSNKDQEENKEPRIPSLELREKSEKKKLKIRNV